MRRVLVPGDQPYDVVIGPGAQAELGLVLAGTAGGRGLTVFLVLGSFVGILGTALAAWLLDSTLLLALMLVCAIGWLLRVITRHPARL